MFVLATSFILGCGHEHHPTVSATLTPTTFASGSTVTLNVETTDFEIRNPADVGHQHLRVASGDDHNHDHGHDHGGDELTANAGHYHVYLDSTDVNPITQGYKPEIQFVVTATPGAHKLIIRLNDDSHAYLKPEVRAEIDITVE